KGLPREHAQLGYRIYAPPAQPVRDVISGDTMQWTDDGERQFGRISLTVPAAAVLNCVATYKGLAQAHYWITDPANSHNPRRAAYEAFEPKLEGPRAAFDNASQRGQDARQLEPAFAMLLWLLGFNVVHLGLPRVRDAADILATTPAGNFAVVECTTGLLKA